MQTIERCEQRFRHGTTVSAGRWNRRGLKARVDRADPPNRQPTEGAGPMTDATDRAEQAVHPHPGCAHLAAARAEIGPPLGALRSVLTLLADQTGERLALTPSEARLLDLARGHAEHATLLLEELASRSASAAAPAAAADFTADFTAADPAADPAADGDGDRSGPRHDAADGVPAALSLRQAAARMADAARTAGVHLVIAPALAATRAPADHVVTVLASLTANALQAAGEGGRVRLAARADGDSVEFTVTDSGPGLDDAALAAARRRLRHAEPFSQLRSRDRGLGLAVCADVVRRHQGSIDVDRAPGGTTVRFRLPAAPARHVPPPGAPRTAGTPAKDASPVGPVPAPPGAAWTAPAPGAGFDVPHQRGILDGAGTRAEPDPPVSTR
jgi:signal transduction histidine kinase